MTTHVTLSDATIEAALERCVARVSADGLHESIMADVARMAPTRRRFVPWPEWPAWVSAVPRFVRIAVVAALVAAVLGATLLVGGRLLERFPRHPADLVPTGATVYPASVSALGQVVADSSGMAWAFGADVLARLGPSGSDRGTWTYADDAAFLQADTIIAARGGGVWLVPPDAGDHRSLRWFDGVRFADVITAPPGDVKVLAETPDQSVWVGGEAGLFRWDGTVWSTAPPGPSLDGVSAMAVDRAGAVWVGGASLSRYDGVRWVRFDEPRTIDGIAAVSGTVVSIAAARDGSILVVSDAGVAGYDGRAWTVLLPDHRGGPEMHPTTVTTSSDGTIWVGGSHWYGVSPAKVLAARRDGARWTQFTSADGLPLNTWSVTIAATPDVVLAGTWDGLYRLVGDRWERALPDE